MTETMRVFNRRTVRRHRDRAAPAFAEHAFLIEEVAERLADRLLDVKRAFPLALDLGCHSGEMGRALQGRGGVQTLLQADLSPALAARAAPPAFAADEEALPIADGTLDLVLSCLSLHWVNDLPGALVQVRRALKPDGLFLGAMLGGETLRELRGALAEAEIAEESGLSPRVSPFADVRDAGDLMSRAGFALPVMDTDTLTVSYPDPFKLMADLRGMGETNAVIESRKSITRRATLMRAAQIYREHHGDDDGRIPATFQVIYLTGWAPAPDQPKALQPGSGKTSLKDALKG